MCGSGSEHTERSPGQGGVDRGRIVRRLRDAAGRRARSTRVADVCIGLGYTAVRLEDSRTGAAYTFRTADFAGCSAFDAGRSLAGSRAEELLEFVLSPSPVETAVGLATVNALVNADRPDAIAGDVLSALDLNPDDYVCMVGNFRPLVGPIRETVDRLDVFDDFEPHRDSDVLPPDAAYDRLPNCTAAVITATALLNGTMQSLLDAAGSSRAVAVVGSSTPMVPEAFSDTPVTLLSGMTVTDPDGLFRVIKEGGGTRRFRGLVKKWNIPLT